MAGTTTASSGTVRRLPEKKRSCPVLIVCGDRRFVPEPPARDLLAYLLEYLKPRVVCHGNGGKTDEWAGATASTHGYTVKVFDAAWMGKGDAAGPIRNREMAQFAKKQGGGYCVCFPGRRGTFSMFEEARKAGLSIIDLRFLDQRGEKQSIMF